MFFSRNSRAVWVAVVLQFHLLARLNRSTLPKVVRKHDTQFKMSLLDVRTPIQCRHKISIVYNKVKLMITISIAKSIRKKKRSEIFVLRYVLFFSVNVTIETQSPPSLCVYDHK